ncbi:50S ribosomal protein L22, partial [Thermoproteota archaeon]
MTQYKYSFEGYNSETMAKAAGVDLGISTKQSIEICNHLRKKKLIRAKTILNEVIDKKTPIPFKRFTDGVGHRKGKLASGRYPIKSSKSILIILESAETNAQQKGLNTSRLSIVHLCAKKASSPMKFGRHRGREAKRTHIEVVLSETEDDSKKKTAKAHEKKQEAKPVEKKIEKTEAQKEP